MLTNSSFKMSLKSTFLIDEENVLGFEDWNGRVARVIHDRELC